MTVYHYRDSSQVVLVCDRVQLPERFGDKVRGEVKGLYLVRQGQLGVQVPEADIQVDNGPQITCPIVELTYLIPEAELAEAQVVKPFDPLPEWAQALTGQGATYSRRLDALTLAVAALGSFDLASTPGGMSSRVQLDLRSRRITQLADAFLQYLDPPGSGSQDTQS
jgi:hypothetical protein